MSQGPYQQLPGAKDDHDDSASDITIPFLDSEDPMGWKEGYERAMPGRRSRVLSVLEKLKPLRWILEAGLVVAVIILLVQRQDHASSVNADTQELGGDISGIAPRFSQKLVTFEYNDDYIPTKTHKFFRAKTHRKWLELVPKGLGFLEIQNPDNFDNLPVPLNDFGNKTVFTTSMTHQLHCLHSIYLRQSIMCCGDVALEGAETTFPEGERGGSDGWGAQHVCKNYDEIYKYLEAGRATDENWI
ncbi:unnamed protein product [Parascedosporium putredinis]|uniref:Uncharacterized protein n=1 Tax=Parascedosporium putredinis TaxID=1442378 RepID=A0A9P1H2G4_9PEZI|nr:unnamed protein product [Parascedosporium putredinis]CAI7994928.1 unnamed protein product [Parascedosporium putredinis]